MFVDTNTMTPYYGIKVFAKGEWIDAGGSGGRFAFKTESECDAKRKEVSLLPEIK